MKPIANQFDKFNIKTHPYKPLKPRSHKIKENIL